MIHKILFQENFHAEIRRQNHATSNSFSSDNQAYERILPVSELMVGVSLIFQTFLARQVDPSGRPVEAQDNFSCEAF